MENNISKITPVTEEVSGSTINHSGSAFFKGTDVKEPKNRLLKERLRTLIKDKLEMSEADFYNYVLKISRQYWYALSYGIFEATIEMKIKISRALKTDSSLIFQNDILEDGNNRIVYRNGSSWEDY